MIEPIGQAIHERQEGGRRVFVLPSRNRQFTSLLNAVLFLCVGAAGLAGFLYGVLHAPGRAVAHGWHWLAAVVFLLGRGLWILLPNWSEIHVDGQDLVGVECAGPLRFENRVRADQVLRLEVDASQFYRKFLALRLESLGEAHLAAELADGQRVFLAVAYSKQTISEIARRLGPLIATARGESPASASADGAGVAGGVGVVDVSDIPPEERDVAACPEGCTIQRMSHQGVETFILGRCGSVRRWRDLLALELGLSLALMFFATILGVMLTAKVRVPAIGPLLFGAAALMLLAAMVRGVHQFLRRGVLVASPEGLTFATRGPLRRSERHWPREQIRTLRTERKHTSFRMSVAEAPPAQLYLRTVDGQNHPLLSGPELEMRWLGTQLRDALHLPLT